MKKIFLFSLIFSYFFNPCSFSQIQNQIPSIEVSGNALIKVVPDMINFYLSVRTENNNIMTAKNDADRAVAKVIDLLKDKGILDKDIQTSGINIYNSYGYEEEGKKHNMYSISNGVSFTLKDINKYYDLTTEIFKIEHVLISNSYYDYSNIIETRKHARELALLAAKDKANEMSSILGHGIGKTILISEEPVYDYYPNPFNASTQQGTQNLSSDYTMQAGTIKVEAKVKVIFELINNP